MSSILQFCQLEIGGKSLSVESVASLGYTYLKKQFYSTMKRQKAMKIIIV